MSEKKLSAELRESQASKWTQLVNPYAWADRAAALEAEVEELRAALPEMKAGTLGTRLVLRAVDITAAFKAAVAERDALAAENERLNAAHAWEMNRRSELAVENERLRADYDHVCATANERCSQAESLAERLTTEDIALKARIAEALDWALCTDDDHLRRILAPEGGDL